MEDQELLYFINYAIALHYTSKPLQRAALQLFEAIIENTDKKAFAAISSRIFKPVLDNLLLNSDDISVCFGSFSILNTLAGSAATLIAPWTDQIINLTISTISRQASAEVTSKCLQLLDQIIRDKDSLLTVAGHDRGLLFFVDALIPLQPKHARLLVINLNLLHQIIEDYDIATVAFQSIGNQDPLEYAIELRKELKEKFDKFLKLCSEEDNLDDRAMQQVFLLYSQVDLTLEEMIKEVPEEDVVSTDGGGDQPIQQPDVEQRHFAGSTTDADSTQQEGPETPVDSLLAGVQGVETNVPDDIVNAEELPMSEMITV